MEIVGLIAAVIGIVTGVWFLWEKYAHRDASVEYGEFKQGFLKEIRLEKTPLFATPQSIKIGRRTVLVGNNCTGKTAVTEWLSALAGTKKLARWMHPTGDFPIVFSVIYQQLAEHVIRVNIEGDVISFNVDGNAVPECPFPLKVFFVEQRQFSKEGMDDADVIAMHLGLDKVTLNNYADQIGKAFYCTINSIQFKKEDGETNVYVDMQGTVPGIRFPLLSGSEQGRALMELGIAVAQFLSRRMPVLLVIERNTFSFGDKLVKKYLDFFEVNEFNFQVILVSSEDDIKWHGWKVTEFQGERPNVKILQ